MALMVAAAAADPGGGAVALVAITMALLLGILVLTVFVTVLSRFRRCPANKVLVITGRTLTGKPEFRTDACLVWPLVQEWAYLDLTPLTLTVILPEARSADSVPVTASLTLTVAVGRTPELLATAANRLVGLAADDIKRHAQNAAVSVLVEVVAGLPADDIARGDLLRQRAGPAAEAGLAKLGLELVAVTFDQITVTDPRRN